MMPTKELTNELIAEKLTGGMVYRGEAGCIENCTQWGIYTLTANSTTTETPPFPTWNYGWLEVKVRNSDIHQRLTHIDGYAVFVRVRRNGVWKPWYQISMTPVA